MDDKATRSGSASRWRMTAGLVGLALLVGIGIGLHLRAPTKPIDGARPQPAVSDPVPGESPDPEPVATTPPDLGRTAAATGAAGSPKGWIDREEILYHGIPSRIRFRLPEDSANRAEEVARAAWDEFRRVGNVFNAFDPASEVGTFNGPEFKQIRAISSEFSRLLELSREVAEQTGGAFDPTIWPLKRLWREAARQGRLPTDAEVEAARAPVGMNRLVMMRRSALQGRPSSGDGDPSLVHRAMAGVSVDFGGIVKGYAVDRVAELLRGQGATDYLVQCGGEIAAHGRSPSGEPWRIGVQHPLDRGAVWGSVSSAQGLSVSTSGNYEQPIRIGDQEFHHVLDPRTGRPVASSLLGVTVAVVGSAMFPNARADAFATALTVMGVDAGRALVEARPEMAALFIVRGVDGKPAEVATSRWAALTGTAR